MKKFSMDRPDHGLFDPVEYNSAAQARMVHNGVGTVPTSAVWDAALERRSGAFGLYRNGIKRLLDLTMIFVALPFWLPVIALCAAALWLEGGQPFYRQDRLGRGGNRFSILKLRTMVCNADEVLQDLLAQDPKVRAEWDALQKLRNDPRITPVGRFLRATSLDELPQLINVLKGEMSLVGPRPMLPEQLSLYGDPRAFFAVRPGLTGLWQVSARNNNKFTYRHGVDAAYEAALTFGMDISILFRTVGVVLRRTGC